MRRRMVWVLLVAVSAGAGCGKQEKSTPELLQDLKGRDERDRVIAVRTLPDRSGDAAEVVPALVEALNDREADVRRGAALGLGSYGERAREAVPALLAVLSDRDARVREAAGKALTRIDPEKYPVPPKGRK
jgi:vesicle coat complex subunit